MCQNLHLIFQFEKRRGGQLSTSCLSRSLDNAADWRTVFHGDKLGFNGQYVYYRNSSVWVSVWCETQRLCVCRRRRLHEVCYAAMRNRKKVNSLKINSFSLDVGGKKKKRNKNNATLIPPTFPLA